MYFDIYHKPNKDISDEHDEKMHVFGNFSLGVDVGWTEHICIIFCTIFMAFYVIPVIYGRACRECTLSSCDQIIFYRMENWERNLKISFSSLVFFFVKMTWIFEHDGVQYVQI